KNNQGQVIGKVDYQASANHSILARYMITFDQQNASWPSSGNVLTTAIPDAYQKHTAHSLALGDTQVFGSDVVNSFRLSWNQTNAGYHLEKFFGAEDVGVKDFYNYTPGIMGITVSNAFTAGSSGAIL